MRYILYILPIIFFFLPFTSLLAAKTCPGSPIKTSYELIPTSWNLCIGIFINTNKGYEGDKYEGEFKNGKFNGKGTHTWADGGKFEGYFKNHKRHGEGIHTWNDGGKYIGEWKNDKIFYGTHKLANGNIYVGEWENGVYSGEGTYYYLADNAAKGQKYVGEWKNGNYHGEGTHTFADGGKYTGNWKDGKFFYGTHALASGDKYVGEWENGKYHGFGSYFNLADNDEKGAKYVGEWKDGNYHGQGIYSFADGRVWEGEFKNHEWVNGKKYAKGEYIKSLEKAKPSNSCPGSPIKTYYDSIPDSWNNCSGTYVSFDEGFKGNTYIGEFKNGQPNGKGTYYFLANNEFKGDKYEGEIKNGEFFGMGTYYFEASNQFKGDKYEGEFKNSVQDGMGTYYYLADNAAKGDKYIGVYKDGSPKGWGTYFFNDGRVWEGEFNQKLELIDGKKYAKGEYNFSNTSIMKQCPGSPIKTTYTEIPSSWHNCKGKVTSTKKSTKGSIYYGEFKNSEFDGVGTLSFNDGDVYEGEWKKGKYHGQGTHTFSDGGKYIGKWINNSLPYGTHMLANGDKYEGQWKNMKYHGIGTYYYYSDDELRGSKYKGEWKNGEFDGKGTYTYNDGRVWDGLWKKNQWVSGKKYEKGEFEGSVLAEEATQDNSQIKKNQEALRKERQIRKQLERELADIKNQRLKQEEIISSDIEPPNLLITSSLVKEKKGIIKGSVKDNNKIAELTINAFKVNIMENGNFKHNIFVPKEGIEVVVEATDYAGLSTKKTIFLEREIKNNQKIFSFAKLNPLNKKGKKNKNAIALIIGISKYTNAPEAKYADRDANYFSDFAESILGINKSNIKLISNNSASNIAIKKALKIWLKGYSNPNQSDIYIFFAGHGLASTDGKELYLLPYDGEPRLLEDTALLRSEIFNTVKSIKPKSVTVFLDACYSGQSREKDMILADARPITIVPIETAVPKNFTVFSASSGSEISGSLPEADHGLFSYFLMKGLEGDADVNNDKKVTSGELYTYVHANVTRQAIRLGREQTPQLQGDENRILVEYY